MIALETFWPMLLIGGLSLSLGWGIRGNFGHESGAAIPGALAAMAIVLVSGRPDWMERIHFFALAGALGWSIGGSMSYMQVVAYTHSGHTPSILYGFANLFLIGFLWAFLGGMGFGLVASLNDATLALFFAPVAAILMGWALQEIAVDWLFHIRPMRRHESRLYWYDTDWLEASVAGVATLIVVAFRGGFDSASSFFLHLSVGWFVGFLALVNVLKLRMTPPRGDNWSGCVGAAVGGVVFCLRHGMTAPLAAALVTAFIGGIGYSFAQLIKLACVRTGRQTNWHSVLEQTQGLFFGIAYAVAAAILAERAPMVATDGGFPAWSHVFAVAFVVLLMYVNHRKATGTWMEQVASLPERFYGLPTAGWFRKSRGWIGWFEVIYIAIGVAVVWLSLAHQRAPLAFLPEFALGRSQLLFMLAMWWSVVFNFERALTGFTPARIVTEGAITLNAVICTVLTALLPGVVDAVVSSETSYAPVVRATLLAGAIGVVVLVVGAWAVTRAMFGDDHAPHAGHHVRFGANRTATSAKPSAGADHP